MKISDQRFRELLNRYLDDTASPEEREWLDAFFDSYRPKPSNLDAIQNDPVLRQEILLGIHSRVKSQRQRKSAVRLWLPIAAVISLFVLAYYFTDNETISDPERPATAFVDEKTSAGQKLLVVLPDGSRVHLNAMSTIKYPEVFAEEARNVEITGEAYFEVVKRASPFVVRTRQIKTEVLGTSFNIKTTDPERVEVTLVEGRVNVVTPRGRAAELRPNQQAIIKTTSDDIDTRNVDIFRYTSWKDNVLYFENATLQDAIAAVELWYAVKVDIMNPALENCVITAQYKDEPLGNVLSSLQFLLNLEIKGVAQGHYALNGKGCK